MTPKVKAEKLVKLYAKLIWDEKEFKMELYKQCALIAVNEILQHCYEVMKPFWQEVKQEINNL